MLSYTDWCSKKSRLSGEHEVLDETTPKPEEDEANLIGITVPIVLAIVIFISTTLMLLYFFYNYLGTCNYHYFIVIQSPFT